jgi:hypothetical protein
MNRYIVYGKIGDMKRFSPMGGASFVTNLIHAEVFTTETLADRARLDHFVEQLAKSNGGKWELRETS